MILSVILAYKEAVLDLGSWWEQGYLSQIYYLFEVNGVLFNDDEY